MPFGPGETFERYAIEALIGRGGMGEVYRATDTRLRRKVALKVIRPDKDRPDAAARLYREARAAAALTHPNAVAVHDVGEAEGVFYIVMELVVGQPLLAYVGDPRVTVLKKIAWLTDVARTLAAAHRAGIIHRDVKPSNVMVSEDGFAKVLDFGLARPLGPIDPVSFRTQEGRVLGTLRYMAPEQIVGVEADARSDQYAFGLTAYELLSGTHPGGAMIEAKPKRVDEIANDVPTDTATLIARTLARDPGQRYASMEDVVHALEASISTMRAPPPHATPPPIVAGRPATSDRPSDETAETMSAERIQIAMRPSSNPGSGSTTLAALAEAGSRESRMNEDDSTLVTKEAPSALVRGRAGAAPAMKTLPLGQVATKEALAATAMSPGTPLPPVSPAPAVPRTLVSGSAAPPKPTSNPPPAAAATPAPIVTIPSTPPPRHPSRPPPQDNLKKTIVVSVAVLSVAAFAGTYFGSQRSAPPGPAIATPSASTSASAAAIAPAATAAPTATVTPLVVTGTATAAEPAPSSSTAPRPTSSTTKPTTTGKSATHLGF